MRLKLMLCALGLVAAGCLDDSDSPPPLPGMGGVVVYEPGPYLQQCGLIAVTRTQSAARLTSAGVEVLQSSCGIKRGVFHPTVCGAGTPEILLHEIPAVHLAAAESAGFQQADRLIDAARRTGWSVWSCPLSLHAIEVAQATTSCAETRNRVFFIQSVSDYDQRMVLLDQAGACADASYRQVLFGDPGDRVLCSIADSFAGPQKACPVPSYMGLFDTILANLDKPDLGLGTAFTVGLAHPAD